MAKSKGFAALYTLRKDGLYMGYWHELVDGQPKGPRHAIYDRDPARLHARIQELETPGRRLLKDLAEEWEQLHREEVSDRTWANYKPQLLDMLEHYGDRLPGTITVADINQDLLALKARGYSHTVVNTRRSLWRMLLDYAVGERVIPYNPALSVKNPKGLKKGRRSAPSDAVLSEILAGAKSTDFPFIPFFLLCTGCRRSEALQRRKEDLDLQAWELHIPRAKTAAGVRTVPIIPPLREPLKAWMAAHPGPWLFPHLDYYAGRKGGPGYMSDTNWETAWQKYCEERGWVDPEGKPTLGAHHLRHGTATLLYESGVDVYTAQHILGHASVTTTLAIYTDLRREHEQKNVDLFGAKLTELIKKSAVK